MCVNSKFLTRKGFGRRSFLPLPLSISCGYGLQRIPYHPQSVPHSLGGWAVRRQLSLQYVHCRWTPPRVRSAKCRLDNFTNEVTNKRTPILFMNLQSSLLLSQCCCGEAIWRLSPSLVCTHFQARGNVAHAVYRLHQGSMTSSSVATKRWLMSKH